MAVNLASKYSGKVDERFNIKSATNKGLNNDYEWTGVETVKVYSVATSKMNDYTRTGNNRYGTPEELQDTVQDLKLTKDRSFTFTIDRGNREEQMMVKEAGKALARQLDEVAFPEIDMYRISKWVELGQTTGPETAITKDNAYEMFLKGQEKLDDEKVPVQGRLCYCTPQYYNKIKLDSSFTMASETNSKKLINGEVGDIDGVRTIKLPSSYFPAGVAFVIIHPICCASPKKLETYKTHVDPPGINGWLVEGRIIYDCFVLENKKKSICVHRETAASPSKLSVEEEKTPKSRKRNKEAAEEVAVEITE